MKDPAFISTILGKGDEAREKVNANFLSLSLAQLNWQPSPDKWSIAQCLHHLIVADSCYFPDLKAILEDTYKMTFWEKYSPLTSMWGGIMIRNLKEEVGFKMKAPGIIQPASSNMPLETVQRYTDNLDIFLNYISQCNKIDIDKVIINSPLLSLVTYSLRDAFQFLVQHEHRHINQAIRVKKHERFPK